MFVIYREIPKENFLVLKVILNYAIMRLIN